MSGYDGFSMSNNARDAYDQGKRPLSQFKAADLKAAGWPGTLAFAQWLGREGHWQPCEWHHSSKEFNATDFFDPIELVEWWDGLDDAERSELLQRFISTIRPRKAAEEVRVEGTYIAWSGSRRHPKATEVEFTGTLRGDWITLDGGGRKKASGRHITYRAIDE